MRNYRKSKTITIIALTIAIIGLSVGFAVYSSTLKISGRANVTPTGGMNVLFASQVSTSDQGLSYKDDTSQYTVAKSVSGLAVADNTLEYPTISNLNATFTEPGDSVTYTFYVVNDGQYDAYLTNLIFNNANGASNFKDCQANASSDNPATNASSVCSGINFSVKIGNENPVSTTTNLNNHLLEKNMFETVIVTIAYTGSVYADGAITVTFGDVELQYRTIDEPIAVTPSEEQQFLYTYVYDAPVTYSTSDDCESKVLLMDEEMDAETAKYACNNPLDEVIYNMTNGYISSADEPYYTAILSQLVSNGALVQHSEGSIIGVNIVGMDNSTSTINIPSTINNYPVIKIQAMAFEEKNIISNITIPYTVEEIEVSAFTENPIQTIVIGDPVNGSNLTNIGDSAFDPDDDEQKEPYPNISSITIYTNENKVTLGEYSFGTTPPTISWIPVN